MNIIQQIIDFILGLLGQKPDSPKELPPPKASAAPDPASEPSSDPGDDAEEEDGDDDAREPKVLIRRDGAALIEDPDDGERTWSNEVETRVAREAWTDVWGPLAGPTDDALAEFMMHQQVFGMTAQGDPEEAEEKLRGFGYADAGEFFKVSTTVLKHFGTPHGPDVGDASLDSQRVINASMRGSQMAHRATMEQTTAADPTLLEPIEGVDMKTYAAVFAQAAGKSEAEWAALLASHGLDLAKWERVSTAWGQRMQNDTTHTLTTMYAEAFQSVGAGQFGAHAQAQAAAGFDPTAVGGQEPMSLERCCEIQGACQAWSNTGQDVNANLAQVFGLTAQDFATAHSWWLMKLATDVARFSEYTSRVEAAEAKYTAGAPATPDSDLDF